MDILDQLNQERKEVEGEIESIETRIKSTKSKIAGEQAEIDRMKSRIEEIEAAKTAIGLQLLKDVLAYRQIGFCFCCERLQPTVALGDFIYDGTILVEGVMGGHSVSGNLYEVSVCVHCQDEFGFGKWNCTFPSGGHSFFLEESKYTWERDIDETEAENRDHGKIYKIISKDEKEYKYKMKYERYQTASIESVIDNRIPGRLLDDDLVKQLVESAGGDSTH